MNDAPTPRRSAWAAVQNNLILGLFTILPLAVVWFVLSFLVDFLSWIGRPLIETIMVWSGWREHDLSGWLRNEALLTALAVIIALWLIYTVGAVASNVLGARLIGWFDRALSRVPLVSQVYGAVQKLIQSLNRKPDGVQRVVLLPFPNEQLRAIGFVTKTFTDSATGRDMAAVYMPTAVNPTCGYLEIVPVEICVETDLTADQAMNMILSGGATAPDAIRFGRPA